MSRFRSVNAWLLVAVLCAPSAARAIDSADDICGPAVNPCNITSSFVIDDGSVLDFGTRTVQILAGGRLDTGAGTATVKCGKFVAETDVVRDRISFQRAEINLKKADEQLRLLKEFTHPRNVKQYASAAKEKGKQVERVKRKARAALSGCRNMSWRGRPHSRFSSL